MSVESQNNVEVVYSFHFLFFSNYKMLFMAGIDFLIKVFYEMLNTINLLCLW